MSKPNFFASRTCVVTGANRGIGLALAQALLRQGATVHAGVRRPAEAHALAEAGQSSGGRLHLHALDVSRDDAVHAFAKALPEGPLHLLINNAGVNLDGRAGVADVTGEVMTNTFNSNTLGPLRLVQALMPRLRATPQARVANISSVMGSLAENSSGGSVAYRTSKTALNMVTQCLALAEKEIIFLTMHPGWVQTEMGGAGAPVTPADSAAGLLAQMAAAKGADSGHFVRFDGKRAAW